MSGAASMPPPPGLGAGMSPAGGMTPPDPNAAPDAGSDDSDSDVLVTITKSADGSYLVFAGDEPSDGGDDSSDDDADAMGGGGAPASSSPSAQGIPADSVGAALKAALDIMNADQSSAGAPGDADSQFAGGFNASKSPTPATGAMKQKY